MATLDLQQLKNRYGIVGRDEKLDNALNTALVVASTDLSVLIQGESGVGKEVLPRIIHDNSLRKSKRYIAINCGSIPEGTIDSELFGHEKGAFTGAIADHEGYFGAADGGTLFLDEVGELPLSTQVRLLRVLETGEYVRVGSNDVRKTNVRIVAATNVKMEQAIREGRFREDLYYRLCTISIQMPALRDRGRDAVLLFKKFALDTAQRYKIPEPLQLTPAAEGVVMGYKWPGNVRQLKNVVEQMSILCESSQVTPEVLAQYRVTPNDNVTDIVSNRPHASSMDMEAIQQNLQAIWVTLSSLKQDVDRLKSQAGLSGEGGALPLRQLPATIDMDSNYKALEMRTENPRYSAGGQTLTAPEVSPVRVPATSGSRISADMDDAEEVIEEEDLNLEKTERRLIEKALQRYRNRRKMAAEELGISERTLYRKIKDYGLEE